MSHSASPSPSLSRWARYPADIGGELRIDAPQPRGVGERLVHERHPVGEKRGLRVFRWPSRGGHLVRNESVFLLELEHRVEGLARQTRVEMPPADRMEHRIPEPHVLVRPAVGRRPLVMHRTFGRAELAFHHRKRPKDRSPRGPGNPGQNRLIEDPSAARPPRRVHVRPDERRIEARRRPHQRARAFGDVPDPLVRARDDHGAVDQKMARIEQARSCHLPRRPAKAEKVIGKNDVFLGPLAKR